MMMMMMMMRLGEWGEVTPLPLSDIHLRAEGLPCKGYIPVRRASRTVDALRCPSVGPHRNIHRYILVDTYTTLETSDSFPH